MASRKRILAVFGWPLLPVDRLEPRTSLHVCERALELWKTGGYNALLLSGGRFLPREIQTRAWSEIARDWFLERGVAKGCIILETSSFDMYDNIRYSIHELCLAGINPNTADITVCTHPIHGHRIQYTFAVAHTIDVRIAPVMMSFTWRERFWQWLMVVYHYVDVHGILYARSRRIHGRHRLGLPRIDE